MTLVPACVFDWPSLNYNVVNALHLVNIMISGRGSGTAPHPPSEPAFGYLDDWQESYSWMIMTCDYNILVLVDLLAVDQHWEVRTLSQSVSRNAPGGDILLLSPPQWSSLPGLQWLDHQWCGGTVLCVKCSEQGNKGEVENTLYFVIRLPPLTSHLCTLSTRSLPTMISRTQAREPSSEEG